MYSSMEKKNDTLILGVGNYLMGDEGLGVHVARELQEEIPETMAWPMCLMVVLLAFN
ncbi:MAG: hypothetical protein MUC73_11435 [Cyclobacteriaceae bacterium]|nr:hypothetical protein [Cyclobacteriaceae bacterium]